MIWNTEDDLKVAMSDPLQADNLLRQVPLLNQVKDIEALVALLKKLCINLEIAQFNELERQAIVRDIGILLGSLKRHGAEPIPLVPEVEPVLIKAGEMADLPARDILLHYTIWNPTGPRQRKYTAHPQEAALIESMRMAIPQVREACRKLARLKTGDFKSIASIEIAFEIDYHLKAFLEGLKYSKEQVDADVFIKIFRPYFEPITVNNKILNGPGAVTMPLHIFDYLLWGCSEQAAIIHNFTAHYVPYNLPEFRSYYQESIGKPSFLDMLTEEFYKQGKPKMLYLLLKVVNTWLKRLTGFRKSHLKYANEAYHGTVKHNFKTGSGGHPTSDLVTISERTMHHKERLKNILNLLEPV